MQLLIAKTDDKRKPKKYFKKFTLPAQYEHQ